LYFYFLIKTIGTMKNSYFLFVGIIIGLLYSCHSSQKKSSTEASDSTFRMVFMTDIHLQQERNAVNGFRKAMDTINKLNPELVVTGGDLVMDALGQTQSHADSLYSLYQQEIKRIKAPVYNTVGNHELFGVLPASGIDTSNDLYGIKMFQSRFGKSYYSFQHKKWKFFVLEDVAVTKERGYIGKVLPEQLLWLKSELAKTDTITPLVIILHMPLITCLTQFKEGALVANKEGLVVDNSKEILDLFQHYNLKLVLQGHLHILEDNYIGNIHFITGGAICGAWWKGPFEGTQEGFLVLDFTKNQFHWKYVDYGWTPEKK
jgi:3',5'-cyclic-AMP phosphodiesterase